MQTEDREAREHERRWRWVATGGCALYVLLGVVVIMVLVSLLSALAGPSLDGCGPEPADPRFCLAASIQQRQVVVTGSTTLPDGALIHLWIESYDHFEEDEIQSVEATTSGGGFRATFDVSAWHPGHLGLAAQLTISDQPSNIVARYGSDGARLMGPATRYNYHLSPPPQGLEAWVDLELVP